MRKGSILFLVVCVLWGGVAVHAGLEVLNLTAPGSDGYVNGAYFRQYNDAPTGTGLIDPFLQISADIQGHPQHGYNTDGVEQYDTVVGQSHSVVLSDIPTAWIGGIEYREFLLDINQSGGSPVLSVDQIEIYLEETSDIDNHPWGFTNLVFSLNTPSPSNPDNWDYILLDDSAGSGKGDMLALIPNSLFTGPGQYVYLYSMQGWNVDGTDGVEEWAYSTNGAFIPEPATMCLFGLGGLALLRRRRKA